MNNEEEWITQEEAAERLHVALDTMRRYVREGCSPRQGRETLVNPGKCHR